MITNATIIHALRTKARACGTLEDFIAWSITCREDMPALYIKLFGPKIGRDFIQIYNTLLA
jgi:hypothetical protein